MLTFQEIGGSPSEQYSLEGFTATREFLVPWENRNEFAQAVFGTTAEPARLSYPGRKDVFAWKLRLEPFDPAAIGVGELTDLKKDYVHYNGSYAKAIVDYHTLDSEGRRDGPITEEGTSITYRMVIDAVEELIPASGWRWPDTNQPIPQDMVLSKRIPVTTHHITWSNVVSPPWNAITAMQGTVNSATFQGCLPGTLLFEGAEANKLFRKGGGLEEGPSAYVWALNYAFREKAIKFGGSVYGWNDVYNEVIGQWQNVLQNVATLYDSSDFNRLFQSAGNAIPGSCYDFIRLTAFKIAIALASSVSVETPWPRKVSPPLLIKTVTSP